jgi:DNA-directed RNA polymerase specialized sigma24 family protein
MSEVDQSSAQMAAPVTVAQFLESLPEEEKFILTLHLLRGLSAEVIAGALGVPHRAVESVITVGRTRLISALNPGIFEEK